MKRLTNFSFPQYGFILLLLAGLLVSCTSATTTLPLESPQAPTPTASLSVEASRSPAASATSPSSPEASPVPADWWAYRDESYGFSLILPPQAEVTAEQPNYARIDLPTEPGTNLAEKYLEISILPGVSPCSSPQAQGYEPGAIPKEPVVINGTEFIREEGSEGAAGNFYEFITYSVEKERACISLGFVLHSTNADNYENPPPTYAASSEQAVFDQIMSTFQLDE